MSLWGMTSLFVNLTTVPELTLTDSDGVNGPELKAHEWQPRIACLMAIVAVPPAGAEDATARATNARNTSAAPRTVCLPCISLPLWFGYLGQCRQDVGGRHPNLASDSLRVFCRRSAPRRGCWRRPEATLFVHAQKQLRRLVARRQRPSTCREGRDRAAPRTPLWWQRRQGGGAVRRHHRRRIPAWRSPDRQTGRRNPLCRQPRCARRTPGTDAPPRSSDAASAVDFRIRRLPAH